MKLFIAPLLSMILLVPSLSLAKKYTYEVSGLMCAACENKVKKTLNSVEGVKVVSVSSKTGKAVIEVKEGTDITSEKIQNKLKEEAGFSAKEIKTVKEKKS